MTTDEATEQPMPQRRARSSLATVAAAALPLLISLGGQPALAQSLPEIRLGARNSVPACVTPARMTRFLVDRNPQMLAKFRSIAGYYKQHGERLKVRWDYAFYQMIVETNYLMFRTAAGRGDVSPSQNNFAGIGTTGGGVPGDSFPDVSSGVLGQMQHLVAYSGERVESPVARRTREKQDDIIAASQRLRRPVTFSDLAGRWAVDRRYARSIAVVADLYQRRFCSGRPLEPEIASEETAAAAKAQLAAPAVPPHPPEPGRQAAAGTPPATQAGLLAPPEPAVRKPPSCKVYTASYGGRKNVLIRHRVGGEIHYTALQVLDGQEQLLAESFIRNHAQGGEAIAEYPSRDDALTGAFNRCPGGGQLTAAGRG